MTSCAYVTTVCITPALHALPAMPSSNVHLPAMMWYGKIAVELGSDDGLSQDDQRLTSATLHNAHRCSRVAQCLKVPVKGLNSGASTGVQMSHKLSVLQPTAGNQPPCSICMPAAGLLSSAVAGLLVAASAAQPSYSTSQGVIVGSHDDGSPSLNHSAAPQHPQCQSGTHRGKDHRLMASADCTRKSRFLTGFPLAILRAVAGVHDVAAGHTAEVAAHCPGLRLERVCGTDQLPERRHHAVALPHLCSIIVSS